MSENEEKKTEDRFIDEINEDKANAEKEYFEERGENKKSENEIVEREDQTSDDFEESEAEPPAKEKDDIVSWIMTIAAAALIAFLINSFVIVNATVPTGSMENTIMPKDRIIAFRWAYILGEPKRGDILVFKYPDDETQLYVKRLIGLPGDMVTIIDGLVYINDSTEPLDEPYVNGTPIGSFGPYLVPDDSFFMLGDNRNNSKDARFWINTYVTDEKVLGKVYFKYFPIPKILADN